VKHLRIGDEQMAKLPMKLEEQNEFDLACSQDWPFTG
jgi:hypothetical protein